MITVKIDVADFIAEYANGKYYDPEAGAVRLPAGSDIYVCLYDLLQKRPVGAAIDRGNLEIALPDRRDANQAGGKSPEQFNYISAHGARILEQKLKLMFWAELHEYMDEAKHLHGIQFKESVFVFLRRYNVEAISEDALLKNYQRWRDKCRRRSKRAYTRQKIATFRQ